MRVEYIEKLVRNDLIAKKVDPEIINQAVNKMKAEYSRHSYKGKATAMVAKTIKDAVQLNKRIGGKK